MWREVMPGRVFKKLLKEQQPQVMSFRLVRNLPHRRQPLQIGSLLLGYCFKSIVFVHYLKIPGKPE
jgi:hypothetical protein